MTRSAFAVKSALTVACPECRSSKDERCQRFNARAGHYVFLERVHPARRRIADEQRTREVMEVRKS